MTKKIFLIFFICLFSTLNKTHSYSISENVNLKNNTFCKNIQFMNDLKYDKLEVYSELNKINKIILNERDLKNFKDQAYKINFNTDYYKVEKKNFKYFFFRLNRILSNLKIQIDLSRFYKNIIFWDVKNNSLSIHFIVNQKMSSTNFENEFVNFSVFDRFDDVTTLLDKGGSWLYNSKTYPASYIDKKLYPIEVVYHFPHLKTFDRNLLSQFYDKFTGLYKFYSSVSIYNFSSVENIENKILIKKSSFIIDIDYGENILTICSKSLKNLQYDLINEKFIKDKIDVTYVPKKKNNFIFSIGYFLSILFLVLSVYRLFFNKKRKRILNLLLTFILINLYVLILI